MKREEARREENQRLATLGMLLGAEWVLGRFIQANTDNHGNRYYRFFDKNGVEVDRYGKEITGAGSA